MAMSRELIPCHIAPMSRRARPARAVFRFRKNLQVTGDLLDRLALDEVFAPYRRNRLHDQHTRPPAS